MAVGHLITPILGLPSIWGPCLVLAPLFSPGLRGTALSAPPSRRALCTTYGVILYKSESNTAV